MIERARTIVDLLRLLRYGGPAVCNVSVTNTCNATCGFCNFAYDKGYVRERRWLDADRFAGALAILHQHGGVRYAIFMGGEPLLHPKLVDMASTARSMGIEPMVITNGWLLADKLDGLARAGVKTVLISIDAPDVEVHETNRGLRGVCARIATATRRMPSLGMTAVASVTMSRLIRDYKALASFLRGLGFSAVTFSYPRKTPLGSSSLVWSDDSDLVEFAPAELLASFEAVEELRPLFPLQNPRASIADRKRRLHGEAERFVCYGGYKYFYMDWNYDLWRCENWRTPICSVWEFDRGKLVRDGCTACMADWYRDASVMLHLAVSLGDAFDELSEGRLLAAVAVLADRRNLTSLGAILNSGRRWHGLPSATPLVSQPGES